MKVVRLAAPLLFAAFLIAPGAARAQSHLIAFGDSPEIVASLYLLPSTVTLIGSTAYSASQRLSGQIPNRTLAAVNSGFSSLQLATSTAFLTAGIIHRSDYLVFLSLSTVAISAFTFAVSGIVLWTQPPGEPRSTATKIANGMSPWLTVGRNGTTGGVRYSAVW